MGSTRRHNTKKHLIPESFDFGGICTDTGADRVTRKMQSKETLIYMLMHGHQIADELYDSITGYYDVSSKDELRQIICQQIEYFGPKCNLNWLDVSNITDMSNMFFSVYTNHKYTDKLIETFNGDISKWDVSSVTNMYAMFVNSQFNGDISKWDVSSVTGMYSMFAGSQFNGDIAKWNVANVTSMAAMFTNSQFNGDLSKWDVSSVADMHEMFAYSQFNQDISHWDVSSVTTMYGMFEYSPFKQDISHWDVSHVNSARRMFNKCKMPKRFKPANFGITESFDFNTVQNSSSHIAENSKDSIINCLLTGVPIAPDLYDTVTGRYPVKDRERLIQIIHEQIEYFGNECNLNWIDVSGITDMSKLFGRGRPVKLPNGKYQIVDLTEFNGRIDKWDVSSVTSMAGMFDSCKFNGDISKWDVSSVTNMCEMFLWSRFDGDISKWDVWNVMSMDRMFMHSMFCRDISRWKINPKCTVHRMFAYSVMADKLADKYKPARPGFKGYGQVKESFDFNAVNTDKKASRFHYIDHEPDIYGIHKA